MPRLNLLLGQGMLLSLLISATAIAPAIANHNRTTSQLTQERNSSASQSVRGTITAIAARQLTLRLSNNQTRTFTLTPKVIAQIQQLNLGPEAVITVTVNRAGDPTTIILNNPLSQTFSGTITRLTSNQVTLQQSGGQTRTFSLTPAIPFGARSAIAAQLQQQNLRVSSAVTVAVNSLGTLVNVTSNQLNNQTFSGTITSLIPDQVVLQLVNGNSQTFRLSPAIAAQLQQLKFKVGSSLTLTVNQAGNVLTFIGNPQSGSQTYTAILDRLNADQIILLLPNGQSQSFTLTPAIATQMAQRRLWVSSVIRATVNSVGTLTDVEWQ